MGIRTPRRAAVIPPSAARSDLVYADGWERESGSAEDTGIVNPVINVETAVWIKRELVIRVGSAVDVDVHGIQINYEY